MWSWTNTTLKKQVQYKTCKSKKAYMVLMINKHYERASKPVIQDIYIYICLTAKRVRPLCLSNTKSATALMWCLVILTWMQHQRMIINKHIQWVWHTAIEKYVVVVISSTNRVRNTHNIETTSRTLYLQ